MNKCNFCRHSIPTGTAGAWICNLKDLGELRGNECESALNTMIEYNELRAIGNKTNSEK